MSDDTDELKETVDTREEQFEILRQFINEKVDNGPKGLVVVVGDLNVNSNKDRRGLELTKEEMRAKGLPISEEDRRNFKQFEDEYDTMIDILSNFG